MDLGTAPLAPIGADDHVRGQGPEAVLYLDLACPHCAMTWLEVRDLPLRLCVRHFPVESKRPRAPVLHAASEAVAGLGGEQAFWSFWDSLYEDRGHQDDPHLWSRAEALGLDVNRFDADRRGEAAVARVRSNFYGGIRAGVMGTPTAFIGGEQIQVEVADRLRAAAERSA